MEIKILGTGCANCERTANVIERVAAMQGAKINLIKVTAIEDIMQYGVATTPAVVIDGVVVHSGGVPSAEMVKAWIISPETGKEAVSCCSGGNCAVAPEGEKTETEASACCSGSKTEKTNQVTANSCSTGTCGTDVGAKNGMGVGALINLMAGSMIVLGLVLAHLSGTVDMTSASWLWLPAFVGLNLIQFAFTGFCPAKRIFEKMGVKQSCC